VFYVMNITDLDDKIIIRSRRNHLLKVYTESASNPKQVEADVAEAFAASLKNQQGKMAQAEATWIESQAKKEKYADDNKVAFEEEQAKFKLIANEQKSYEEVVRAGAEAATPAPELVKKLIGAGKGPLAEWLDAAKGAEVTDHSIFKAHASYYE
jgi:cysteinyl-tRNA synthetase